MTEVIVQIPARLKNSAVGGHVAGAADIYDDALGKTQAEINQEGSTEEHPYNPADYSGLGRVVLAKNMVSGVNTLTQDMFYKGEVGSRVPNTNTVFVVQYDFVLGENITIPDSCVLKFEGGSISAGSGENKDTITGNNTSITAPLAKIFGVGIILDGYNTFQKDLAPRKIGWDLEYVYPEWWGAVGDCNTDDIIPIQRCVDNGYKISIPTMLTQAYYISSPIIYNNPILWADGGRQEYYDIKGNGLAKLASNGLTFNSTLPYGEPQGGGYAPPCQYLRLSGIQFWSASNLCVMSDKFIRVAFNDCIFKQRLVEATNTYLQSWYLENCSIYAFNANNNAFLKIGVNCFDLHITNCHAEASTGSFIQIANGEFWMDNCIIESMSQRVISQMQGTSKIHLSHNYFEGNNGGVIVNDAPGGMSVELVGNFFEQDCYGEKVVNTNNAGHAKLAWWGGENIRSIGNTGLYNTANEKGHYFRDSAAAINTDVVFIQDVDCPCNNEVFANSIAIDANSGLRKGMKWYDGTNSVWKYYNGTSWVFFEENKIKRDYTLKTKPIYFKYKYLDGLYKIIFNVSDVPKDYAHFYGASALDVLVFNGSLTILQNSSDWWMQYVTLSIENDAIKLAYSYSDYANFAIFKVV